MSDFLQFVDRVPTLPNRKKITHADSSVEYATVEYADEPIETGTALNKNNFNVLNNILGYQTPSVTTSTQSQTYPGYKTPTSVTPTWADERGVTLESINFEITQIGDIIPIMKFVSNNGFYTNYDSYVYAVSFMAVTNNAQHYDNTSFKNNMSRAGYSSKYYTRFFMRYAGWEFDTVYDFYCDSKPTFDYRINFTNAKLTLQYSDDELTWYNEYTLVNNTDSTYTPASYHRFWRVRFYSTDDFGDLSIYYLVVKDIDIKLANHHFEITTLPNLIDNQRTLLKIPTLSESSIGDTLNDIPIDTILESNKLYELIYKQSINTFIAKEVQL